MPARGRTIRTDVTVAEIVRKSRRREASRVTRSIWTLGRRSIEGGRVGVVAREGQGIVEGEGRSGGWETNRELERWGRLRRVLKVLKTIFHVWESGVHGVHVGRGLGIEVEGQKLRGRHAEKN